MITADDNTSSDDNDGWRNIKGNLKFNNAEHPLSTSSGNVPDIECKKKSIISSHYHRYKQLIDNHFY